MTSGALLNADSIGIKKEANSGRTFEKFKAFNLYTNNNEVKIEESA